ncbi:MAG: hypothetical protein R2854_15430 [Caldilineaceae bacterium]
MSTINLGVIGLGRMGRIFSRHLRRRRRRTSGRGRFPPCRRSDPVSG